MNKIKVMKRLNDVAVFFSAVSWKQWRPLQVLSFHPRDVKLEDIYVYVGRYGGPSLPKGTINKSGNKYLFPHLFIVYLHLFI